MSEPWTETTVESKAEFQGKIVTIRVDRVRLSNGRFTTREIAEHSDSVCVVPVDEKGNILMVRQFRKPLEDQLLEVPAGGIEADERPEEAAIRELQEEVGFTASDMKRLSGFWLAPGWCTEFMYAYLARDLEPSRLPADDDESITVVPVPLGQVIPMMESGEIQDAKSIASLLLALKAVESA